MKLIVTIAVGFVAGQILRIVAAFFGVLVAHNVYKQAAVALRYE
jgi:hypothetical protein